MSTAANSNKPEFTGKTANQVTAFLIVWLLSTAAILAGARTEIRRYSYNKPALSAALVAFALQFAPYCLQGFPAIRKQFELHFSRLGRALLAGLMLLIPYIVYAAGTGSLNALAALKLISITAFSLGIYALIPPNSQRLSWQDLTAMLIIAVPLYTGWYRDIWPFPVYLDVMARLFVVSLLATAVLSVRPLEGVGYVWRFKVRDWLEGVRQLFFFSMIGLPLGFLLRFIAWHPRSESIPAIGFSFLGVFLFIAIMEELFFRGVLQNLLEKSLQNKYLARGIASTVFGLSHIYHGFPNWRYVIMAAIAGWFYGTAWHNRRNIMASSVVHASVDTIWRHFLLVQ